jgi:undecaprenyl-diphosphatase
MVGAMIGTTEQRRRVWATVQWLRNHSHLTLLLALTLAVGGAWAFIEIADEVLEGDTQQFDNWAIRTLRTPTDLGRPLGPTWLHEVGRDVTALGGVFVLTLVTLGVAGYFLMVGKRHGMWLVLAATAGGLVTSTALKSAFDRERPDLVPHLSVVHTSSFPSGHAMLSAVVYLTLGVLLARLVPHRGVKIYFIIIAALLTGMVGVSRIYMGVHYPTDVLAGWTAGLVWASLCYAVARYLQIRGAVERDVDEPGGRQVSRASDPARGGSMITPAHPSSDLPAQGK